MRRREFITLVAGTIVTWSFAAIAQEAGRTYRLGNLHVFPRTAPWYGALFDELRRLGFIEGQNLSVDEHGYGLRVEQLAEHASALVKGRVDVILAGGDTAIRAAQQATATIPILAFADDLVGSGLANSLAKPGGNTTGVSLLASDLDGKRQDILLEAMPGLRHIAVLVDPNTTRRRPTSRAAGCSACTRSRTFRLHRITKPTRSRLQSMRRRHQTPWHLTFWRRLFSSLIGS